MTFMTLGLLQKPGECRVIRQKVTGMAIQKKAFTLIELLVVISIIALLLSILLPSLKKAREAARIIQCKSNLHNIGFAIHMYSEDNNGKIVSGCEKRYSVYYDASFDVLLDPYLKTLSPDFPDPHTGGADFYNKVGFSQSSGLWHCKSDKPQHRDFSYHAVGFRTPKHQRSYSMNKNVSNEVETWGGSKNGWSAKLINVPSYKLLVGENWNPANFVRETYASAAWWGPGMYIYGSHSSDRFNYLFIDLSARTENYKKMFNSSAFTGVNGSPRAPYY